MKHPLDPAPDRVQRRLDVQRRTRAEAPHSPLDHSPRMIAQREQIESAFGTTVQRAEVVQMVRKRNVRNVRFDGSAYALRTLILRWGCPAAYTVTVNQTDHVGGNYDVEFTHPNTAISIDTARGWIAAALARAEPDSSDAEPSSDSE
ncbi:hypothetical protein [Rhizobacter sp. SG703]|uniref:hypothetical protein n=1 Tax=Rhizobacter sp. SG703 TaxID=2587140 RepID=UPI001446E83F|nr:hypothetical protein [Rhizobacter sp. SG703]NKI95236.1 hypothetical protein [Rhizobacter sp. SG703]